MTAPCAVKDGLDVACGAAGVVDQGRSAEDVHVGGQAAACQSRAESGERVQDRGPRPGPAVGQRSRDLQFLACGR